MALMATAALARIALIVAGPVPNILWAALVGAAAGCLVRITDRKKP
ncbi:hypothetical protein [Corynebacterium sp. NML98-0116]|nr:hypothetical protein [Corynebacterium sp. NML98-0116]